MPMEIPCKRRVCSAWCVVCTYIQALCIVVVYAWFLVVWCVLVRYNIWTFLSTHVFVCGLFRHWQTSEQTSKRRAWSRHRGSVNAASRHVLGAGVSRAIAEHQQAEQPETLKQTQRIASKSKATQGQANHFSRARAKHSHQRGKPLQLDAAKQRTALSGVNHFTWLGRGAVFDLCSCMLWS